MLARLVSAVLIAVAPCAASPQEPRGVEAEARRHRLRLEYDGRTFSGPAWDHLVAEGARSQFFLMGEEHGIAENPRLAAQLFRALTDAGYRRLVIEVSPPMARMMDRALADDGLDGLRSLFAEPGGEPAFFGMREEAEMLGVVRASLPAERDVLWGVDYEVGGDRPLLRWLEAQPKPEAAEGALRRLRQASDEAWSAYDVSRNPGLIFSFSGDPALAAELRRLWPGASPTTAWTIETLEETLAINRLWVEGRGWDSNRRRARWIRESFLRHWRAEIEQDRTPGVLVKLGANHVVRGRNGTGTFDLGTLLPELAALSGRRSYSVLVLPGPGSQTAVFDPSAWKYEPKPAKDGYARGLEPIVGAAYDDAFTLIELEPIRSIVGSQGEVHGEPMLRAVHGFDAVLVLSGSTPSNDLR